jgi:hypothetical protein
MRGARVKAGKETMRRTTGPSLSDMRERAWAQLRIRRIELLPMLCTAGIGPVDDGYVIYINSTAKGTANFTKKCLDLTDEDFRSLNVSLRFSVAHEMAHVFFFNALDGDCRNDLLQSHWRAVENSCSQMARVILLPKKATLREIGPTMFATGRLLQIIKRFHVSPAVFIYRLGDEDMFAAFQSQDAGLIACVHTGRGKRTVIATRALGSLGKSRWGRDRWCPEGWPLEKLNLCVDLDDLLQRREHLVFDAMVFWREEQDAPCTVEIQWYNTLTAVLSIRLHGHLEKSRGQQAMQRRAMRDER